MRLEPGLIDGLAVIHADPIGDHRGFFARVWSEDELADIGLHAQWNQGNVQFSPQPGTLRGMHFQTAPHDEVKLVRCTAGAVFDVAVDLRQDSPTYKGWFGIELAAASHTSVWVPEGCAHGFVTLVPDSEVFYLTTKPYSAEAATGVRYDDPAFGIDWPRAIEIISDRDRDWPLYGAEG